MSNTLYIYILSFTVRVKMFGILMCVTWDRKKKINVVISDEFVFNFWKLSVSESVFYKTSCTNDKFRTDEMRSVQQNCARNVYDLIKVYTIINAKICRNYFLACFLLFQIAKRYHLRPVETSKTVKPFVRTVLTLGNDLPVELHDRWGLLSSNFLQVIIYFNTMKSTGAYNSDNVQCKCLEIGTATHHCLTAHAQADIRRTSRIRSQNVKSSIAAGATRSEKKMFSLDHADIYNDDNVWHFFSF